MHGRVIGVACIFMFALVIGAALAPASACPIRHGASLVLVSQELDPDVFLWDSADRLVHYAEGDYEVATVLHHTTLIRAFTRAVALACRKSVIQPSGAEAAEGASTIFLIGVRIAAGTSRGRVGWVISSDTRWPPGQH